MSEVGGVQGDDLLDDPAVADGVGVVTGRGRGAIAFDRPGDPVTVDRAEVGRATGEAGADGVEVAGDLGPAPVHLGAAGEGRARGIVGGHRRDVTGGDRTDIQAAALETSTTCLVLTGNLQPTATIVKRAEEMNVAVLLVPDSTLETVEKLESIFGRTSLGQPEKLGRFQAMLAEHLRYSELIKDLGL